MNLLVFCLKRSYSLILFVCVSIFVAGTTHLDKRLGNVLAFKPAQLIIKGLQLIKVLVVGWIFLC